MSADEVVSGMGTSAEPLAAFAELATQVVQLRDTVAQNTDAVSLNTVAQESGGESKLASAAKSAGSVWSSMFGLSPVITGLVHLFTGGGGSDEQTATLPEYTRPPAIRYENGYSAAPGPAPAPAQITVNVQAMDSRSFLDHSDDIARAVRQAMLNSNSLNDVVNEL